MTEPSARLETKVVVPVGELPAFAKRLKALNAKAGRFGLDPIISSEPTTHLYAIEREVTRSESGEVVSLRRLRKGEIPSPPGELVRMAEIQINYPMIKLGDWRVIAKIEALPGGNLVFTVSDEASDVAAAESHRHAGLVCEHCGTQRRRQASYLLSNAQGEYKEVGQSCLEDFTGIDAGKALFLAKLQEFIAFDAGEGGRSPNCVGTRDFLICVALLAERKGFISVAKARERGERPTWTVAAGMESEMRRDSDLRAAYKEGYERLGKTADAVRLWYALNTSSDGFDANVKALLAGEDLPLEAKYLAFAAAAVPSYLYAQERRLRQTSEVATLKHVGEPKQSMSMRLRVERIIPFGTAYGTAWRINFRDENGNRLSWRTGVPPAEDLRDAPADAWFEGEFRVKEHTRYQGVAQTGITHLKVLSWSHTCENDVQEEPQESPAP